MSFGDLLIGFYVLLVVAFLAREWVGSAGPRRQEPVPRELGPAVAQEPEEQREAA